MLYLPLLLLFTLTTQAEILCDGNHFVFLSTFMLGLQTDLKLTFSDINATAKID